VQKGPTAAALPAATARNVAYFMDRRRWLDDDWRLGAATALATATTSATAGCIRHRGLVNEGGRKCRSQHQPDHLLPYRLSLSELSMIVLLWDWPPSTCNGGRR